MVRGFLVFVLGVVIGVAAIAIGPLPFGATPIDFLACITIACTLELTLGGLFATNVGIFVVGIASLVRLVIIKRGAQFPKAAATCH